MGWPGQLTPSLAERWPTALIRGIDASPDMVERSQRYASGRVGFSLGDARDELGNGVLDVADGVLDVLVSNAALHWVPGHRELLPRYARSLAPCGWLALQVPGNFGEPSHRSWHELAADPGFAGHTRSLDQPAAYDAATIWRTLRRWAAGSRRGRRHISTCSRALRDAYPERSYGTVLPYRRVFVVAQRSGELVAQRRLPLAAEQLGLVGDPEIDQAPEVSQEAVLLMRRVSCPDRFEQQLLEVRRGHPVEDLLVDVR